MCGGDALNTFGVRDSRFAVRASYGNSGNSGDYGNSSVRVLILSTTTGYQLRSFNVGAFAGQTVTVKFTGSEDASLQTSFVVDDAALNAG